MIPGERYHLELMKLQEDKDLIKDSLKLPDLLVSIRVKGRQIVDQALDTAKAGILESLEQHFEITKDGGLISVYRKLLEEIVAGEVRVIKRNKFQIIY